MDFNFDSVLGVTGVALLGILVAAWEKSRTLLARFFSFLFASTEVEGQNLQHAVMYLCWQRYRMSPFGGRSYTGGSTFVKSLGIPQTVLYRRTSTERMTFWKSKAFLPLPLWISMSKPENNYTSPNLRISFLRGTFDVEAFLSEAVDVLNTSEVLRHFYVYYRYGQDPENKYVEGAAEPASEVIEGYGLMGLQPLTHDAEDLGYAGNAQALGQMVLSKEAQEVVSETRHWLDSRQWFRERRIPWKRGYLLTGPPGTGKTSFARGVAESLDLPMFILDLSSMSNGELSRQWRSVCVYGSARVIVIEDLDGVFDGRVNIYAKNRNFEGCTFDCLLQLIDGADRMEGTLLFITSNHPEKLDPAIGGGEGLTVTRPGRIDRILVFDVLDESGALQIAQRILPELPIEELQSLAEIGQGESPSVFQERCFQRAQVLRFGT